MLFTKFALVTCSFYLGITVLLEASVLGIGALKGFGIVMQRPVLYVGFGLIWLLSFTLAWRIVWTPILSRFSK